MTHQAAWKHPNRLLDTVILPDGYQMRRSEAESRGFDVVPWPEGEKAASVHPHEKGNVVLARGVVVAADTARGAGFSIGERIPQAAALSPHRAWRSSIITSPEAKDRPDATAELVLAQNETNMSVDAARAFLRGLPVETEQADTREVETVTIDPRTERLAQISGGTAAFNKSRGYAAKVKTAITPAAVSTESPDKLKRLAEIRQTMLIKNGQDHSQEAKALRLAFDAHHRMGTPFAQALAQSGFDAATLTKNAR